jgi:hypothetical protein
MRMLATSRTVGVLLGLIWAILGVLLILEAGRVGAASSLTPRTLVVGPASSSDFTSIQAAVDAAGKGDTILIKAGTYREDVTVHSKDGLKLIGEGIDRVTILGRERVGVFHIGKWPYGASDIEISDVTINEHGGHAMGIFNGQGIVLRHVRIKGMLFGQQVRDVRIEDCIIGGSETTGVQFADSHAILIGNFIHDNDHGVTVAGRSDVRLERNVITRSLFEGVVVFDKARVSLVSNTVAHNGGGIAFLDGSQGEATANIVGLNKVGFVFAPSSLANLSYNALANTGGDYVGPGPSYAPTLERRSESDILVAPKFVDAAHDDFRPLPDSSLIRAGGFPFLGALPPATSPQVNQKR